MIAAAACHRCPTLVVLRADAPALPDACPSCGTPFEPAGRSLRGDDDPVAFDMRAGAHAVLGLQGELDLFFREQLREAVDAALDPQPDALLVDLTDVTFGDSTMLAALVRAERLVEARGARLVCAVPAGPVRQVIDLAGLGEHLELHDTREAALRALG